MMRSQKLYRVATLLATAAYLWMNVGLLLHFFTHLEQSQGWLFIANTIVCGIAAVTFLIIGHDMEENE